MSFRIEEMDPQRIGEYAGLFAAVFNAEPWLEHWTAQTASQRIESMMRAGSFVGKALYDDGELKGLIWGQKEPFYDGVHFQIQELCVKTSAQRTGCGTALLNALKDDLRRMGVAHLYLITAKGQRTEGFYQKQGFTASDHMILMQDPGVR